MFSVSFSVKLLVSNKRILEFYSRSETSLGKVLTGNGTQKVNDDIITSMTIRKRGIISGGGHTIRI